MINTFQITCSLFFISWLSGALYGQSAVAVSGTVKSKQGTVQSAQVEFYNANNEFESNCISGTNGRFVSEKKFPVGRSVRIKIIAPGFKSQHKDLKVPAGGESGEFMLESGNLTMTGFVRDSVSEQVISGVEVFFYDAQGKLIQAGATNSLGYFEVETDFSYGQKITMRVAKKGYYDDKEQGLTFTTEGINKLSDIMLPKMGDRGLRAFIRVMEKNNSKSLDGATVHYFDKKTSAYIDVPVPRSGEIELKLHQRPGTPLDLQVIRSKYRPFILKAILSEEPLNNVFTCELEKGK